MSYLYENWLSASECWGKSQLLVSIRNRSGSKKRQVRKWMLYSEMEKLWGHDVASDVKDRKLASPELRSAEVRAHPECPTREDCISPYTP